MTRFMGARGVAAVGAFLLLLVGGTSGAYGQVQETTLTAQSFDLRDMPSAMLQAITTSQVPSVAPVAPVLTSEPLSALVDANSVGELDQEANCLATAVYFESKGEPLEGQLAVAQVVMNRAASGRYPASLCGVVKQHAQFSFVRAGLFPNIDVGCPAWRKARAIARIAQKHMVATVATNVLWYHANNVTPRWRQALVKVEQIGAHIFYRA